MIYKIEKNRKIIVKHSTKLKHVTSWLMRPLLSNKKLLFLMLLFFFIQFLINFAQFIIVQLNQINLDSNPSLNDDSNVKSFNYLNDYRQVQSKFAEYKKVYDTEMSSLKTIIPNARDTKRSKRKNFVILEYTKVMDETKYCPYFSTNSKSDNIYAKNQVFIKECPYKNCIFTCNKTELNKVDVVLFHESDLKKDIRKEKNYLKNLNSKASKRSEQIWVLWNDEVILLLINSLFFGTSYKEIYFAKKCSRK